MSFGSTEGVSGQQSWAWISLIRRAVLMQLGVDGLPWGKGKGLLGRDLNASACFPTGLVPDFAGH